MFTCRSVAARSIAFKVSRPETINRFEGRSEGRRVFEHCNTTLRYFIYFYHGDHDRLHDDDPCRGLRAASATPSQQLK